MLRGYNLGTLQSNANVYKLREPIQSNAEGLQVGDFTLSNDEGKPT